MPKLAFLDIDIGDSQKHAEEAAAYSRAAVFLEACGAQYGLTGEVSDLDNDAKDTLMEAYNANPTWSAKGLASTKCPPSLRAGRLVLELFESESPKAVENFTALVTGERGLGKASKKALDYAGCPFHRIVSGFMCQGGDIVKGDGSGGDSIYGGKFNDDKGGLKLKHDGPGVVAYANSGKNSNTSQFYITLAAAPQCDGKHVVFGKVLEGMEILKRIDAEAASPDGAPRVSVIVAGCGVL